MEESALDRNGQALVPPCCLVIGQGAAQEETFGSKAEDTEGAARWRVSAIHTPQHVSLEGTLEWHISMSSISPNVKQ